MSRKVRQLILGIDAHNIRAGGGITHLKELLTASNPLKYGFKKVIVWGGKNTISRLPSMEWLELRSHSFLNKSFLFRLYWLFFIRKSELIKEKCDILFVPGGTDIQNFKPMVTMNQNLLPFEFSEIRRYGLGFKFLKFIALRISQSYTFKRADGVIFLTQYAKKRVKQYAGRLKGKSVIIPHGINPKFFKEPSTKYFRSTESFTEKNPCKIIYVSIIEIYKHQWHVIKAIHELRIKGLNIKLDLVGPPGPGTHLLEEALSDLKEDNEWVVYHGVIPYEQIQELYLNADVGIFASSCETYGQIVSEAMAASLPMACSSLSSMRDVIGENTVYFHPEKPQEIANAVQCLIDSLILRKSNAVKAYQEAQKLTWVSAADKTFKFFQDVYYSYDNLY